MTDEKQWAPGEEPARYVVKRDDDYFTGNEPQHGLAVVSTKQSEALRFTRKEAHNVLAQHIACGFRVVRLVPKRGGS